MPWVHLDAIGLVHLFIKLGVSRVLISQFKTQQESNFIPCEPITQTAHYAQIGSYLETSFSNVHSMTFAFQNVYFAGELNTQQLAREGALLLIASKLFSRRNNNMSNWCHCCPREGVL